MRHIATVIVVEPRELEAGLDVAGVACSLLDGDGVINVSRDTKPPRIINSQTPTSNDLSPVASTLIEARGAFEIGAHTNAVRAEPPQVQTAFGVAKLAPPLACPIS